MILQALNGYYEQLVRNEKLERVGWQSVKVSYALQIDGEGMLIRVLPLLAEEERTGDLPKTVLYCLNPKDNEVMMTMAYTFNDGTCPGKMQFGSGWWFLDQEVGMRRQMDALSVLGLFSRFVGMLTDSRSFISYPRHEYFRRILCDVVGTDVENGKLPASEMERIGQMIEDISYNNAKNYFNF